MKYGLIGEHLGHSFSKQIQTRIAEIVNVKDYDYQLVELNKEEFKEFMEKKEDKKSQDKKWDELLKADDKNILKQIEEMQVLLMRKEVNSLSF